MHAGSAAGREWVVSRGGSSGAKEVCVLQARLSEGGWRSRVSVSVGAGRAWLAARHVALRYVALQFPRCVVLCCMCVFILFLHLSLRRGAVEVCTGLWVFGGLVVGGRWSLCGFGYPDASEPQSLRKEIRPGGHPSEDGLACLVSVVRVVGMWWPQCSKESRLELAEAGLA